MNEALKYFQDMGIPVKGRVIDVNSLTDEHIQLLTEWEEKTQIHGIMMPQIEDFYRSVFVAISLNPQKTDDGEIRYLFGKGIGAEIALRGKVQGRNVFETNPIYRSHSDFELYDAKGKIYTDSFHNVFGSQEFYPPTKTKGLNDIPEGEMDSTHEIVDLDGYKILVPKLELLFLDKFLRKESTPRDSGYDCELLAERYDLDSKLIYEYLVKYYFKHEINSKREREQKIKNTFSKQIIKNLNNRIAREGKDIQQAIHELNKMVESMKQVSRSITMYGIDIDSYTPLTLQDVLTDNQGGYILTPEYIERAKQVISNKTDIEIGNMQKTILQELNDLFEKTKMRKTMAHEEKENDESESYRK